MGNEYQDKIYIIGSVHSNAEDIKKTADYYISTGRYQVRYVNQSSHAVGTHVDSDGTESKTSKAVIAYSKTGTHIYPRKEKNDEN